jgi:uncharacterized protein YndB with AHSA1/START domain
VEHDAAASEGSPAMPASPTWTVTINATPDKVWPMIANLERHTDWSPKPYRMEWVSGEPNAVGSTFRSVGWLPNDKNHEMDGRVSANEPQKVFEVVTHDDKQEWTNRYELSPSGTQTTVTKAMTGPPLSGVQKAIYAVAFAVFVRGGVQKGMNMLKAKVEGSS